MKKKIFALSVFVLLIGSLLILNMRTDTMASPEINKGDYPHLYITVYNSSGSQVVGNARVKVFYGGSEIFSMLSNATSGLADFDMTGQPSGTYTINAYYPDPPNDSNSGSNTVYFGSGNTPASVNLTVFY